MHTSVVSRAGRRRWWRTTLGASALVLTAATSCSLGGESSGNGAEPPASSARDALSSAPATGPSADIAGRELHRALSREQGCPPTCATFDERLERVRDAESASAELERALLSSAETKRSLTIAVSAFRNAYSSLRTCVDLSADKHSGIPEEADCRAVVAEFDRALAELREESRRAAG